LTYKNVLKLVFVEILNSYVSDSLPLDVTIAWLRSAVSGKQNSVRWRYKEQERYYDLWIESLVASAVVNSYGHVHTLYFSKGERVS